MKSKKGVSLMIGYVLLISLAVVMGAVLYVWMKSYVPQEDIKCPDGVSLIVKDYSYNCTTNVLSLKLVNNGNFNISGYVPRASTIPGQELATRDIFNNINKSEGIIKYEPGNAVLIDSGQEELQNKNVFDPGREVIHNYELGSMEVVVMIQLVPVRWQEEKGKLRFVSCGSTARYTEKIKCD